MKTLAVSAVKSNNSCVSFAGKNKKSAKTTAVSITAGALAVAGGTVAVYKNRVALAKTFARAQKVISDFRVNTKFMFLNTIKWLGS